MVTYRVGDSQRRIAIMFSVAYNQLQYRNHFGTAILAQEEICEKLGHSQSCISHLNVPTILEHSSEDEEDEEGTTSLLFERMYQDSEFYQQRGGRCHSLANDGVPMWANDGVYQIRGTMSDRGKAIIKINITPAS